MKDYMNSKESDMTTVEKDETDKNYETMKYRNSILFIEIFRKGSRESMTGCL